MKYDPLARRAYLLLSLAKARNECEVTACEVALRALDRAAPEIKHVSYVERGAQDD